MNRPETAAGWQIWDLVQRLEGQARFAGGVGGLRFTGWDMTAVLAMGEALCIDRALIAEILPAIERAVVHKLREGG